MKRRIRKKNNADIEMLSPHTTVKGSKWEFHKTDDDYYPSVPHGHSLDGKYKLEIWTGNIYNIQSGKLEYKAKRKDMKALYNYPGFQEFVQVCRDEYKKRNPSIEIPELKNQHYVSRRKHIRVDVHDQYIVFIRHDKV